MKKKQSSKKILSKKKPEKHLLAPLKERGGRSSSGRISVRHRGGGAKKRYRIVDFGEEKMGVKGKIIAIEYDPNRTAFLALVEYEDGDRRYILAPSGIQEGDEIICAEEVEIQIGNRMKLSNIPTATEVYNIELEPNQGGKMCRSAGASAKVLTQEDKYTHLKMPSGEIRKVLNRCFASIGQVSHVQHRFEEKGKAGATRWRGKRPSVRGTAMSPPDHPHAGGTGKSPVGLPYPKTPWGKPARGVKTRKKKWTDKLIIKRRNEK